MKKILVPTDFSEHAKNALQIAIKLANKFQAEIHIIHVISPLRAQLLSPELIQVNESLEERYVASIQENVQKVITETLNEVKFPSERSINVIELGEIYERVCKYAKTHQIDLIVMGTNGTRPFDEIFVGSNAERVVRFASCPVLSVKSETKEIPTNPRILLPTDLQDNQIPTIKKISQLAQELKGSLHLIYVNSAFGFRGSEEITRKQQNLVTQAQLSDISNISFHQTTASTEEAGILNMAKHLNVDMIALQTSQRKGLSHFFLGSTAEDVVNHAQIPVIAYGTQKQ